MARTSDERGEGPAVEASSWFQAEGAILAELRRAAAADAPPTIPGYEDLLEIKRGGQGVVYRATQRGTKRPAAIKVLLDSGAFSTTGRRRFEREVDLAAGLRHPGIVRVYDSGVTPEGRAYLVMEFVEGSALDERVRTLGGGVRATVALMVKVCDAVQHAHTRGVIHRDLKPSNIRVDEGGEPRVLDFGLAKITDATRAGSEAGATVTTTGQFLGSLPWASPEQARGDLSQIDTRSDVYALGAVLYQLLTGAMPVDVTGPLHTALSNIVNVPAAPARQRRGDLPEQIDVILAKALRKEPGERYQSAGDLADDLRRHLAGEPIAAQRESAWRGLRRTARRYQAIAGVAGAAMIAVGALGGVAARSAIVAARERDAANQARARSDATVQFLTDLLAGASPDTTGGGKAAKVVDLLDTAAKNLPEAYKNNPVTLARLHDLLGQVYSKLEVYGPAEAQFNAGLAVIDAKPEAFDDPFIRLGLMGDRASLAGMRGDLDASIDLHTKVVAEYDRLGITRNSNLRATLSDLGVAARRQNRLEDAERYYTRALAAETPEGREQLGYAILMANRATLLDVMGKPDQALPQMQEALARTEKLLGPDSLQTANIRGQVAYMYITLGKPGEGTAEMERALAAAEKAAGESNSTTLVVMNNLGKMYQDQGRYEDGLALFRRAISIYETQRPAKDAGVHPPMVNAIACLNELGRSTEALAMADDLLARTRAMGPGPTFDYCNAHHAKAGTLERLGRASEAEALLRVAVEMSGPTGGIFPPGHWRHDLYRAALGGNLLTQGRIDEAAAILTDAYAKLTTGLAPTHPAVKRAAVLLAKLKRAQGDEAGAKAIEAK